MVVALKQPLDATASADQYARLGLVAKVKIHDDPDLVEFCSGYFWHTDEGRVWGPKPGRMMAKLGFSTNEQKEPLKWFKGVLLGVKQDVAHVPILNHYVNHCLRIVNKVGASATRDEHKFHVGREYKPNADTHGQFRKLYGLSTADCDSLKTYISSVTSSMHLLSHPVLDQMVDKDS